ncbi:hypothetical protein HNQ96_004066 [Aminobacter lissarensis]|uniref:Uncharacterized protein n=1 Tax=Aminobacter carboxidus TaxID=376165 RepID=A0A8E1WGN5_9HYPH|nr:hypothetical protein [Aminobacter lissarensis]
MAVCEHVVGLGADIVTEIQFGDWFSFRDRLRGFHRHSVELPRSGTLFFAACPEWLNLIENRMFVVKLP